MEALGIRWKHPQVIHLKERSHHEQMQREDYGANHKPYLWFGFCNKLLMICSENVLLCQIQLNWGIAQNHSIPANQKIGIMEDHLLCNVSWICEIMQESVSGQQLIISLLCCLLLVLKAALQSDVIFWT